MEIVRFPIERITNKPQDPQPAGPAAVLRLPARKSEPKEARSNRHQERRAA